MPARFTLSEYDFRRLVDGQLVSIGDIELILEDIGFDRLARVLEGARLWQAANNPPRPNPPNPPKTIVCVPCWRGRDYGDDELDKATLRHRRFFVRQGDDLVVHRLIEEDDHVVKAACGDLYAQSGLPNLGPAAWAMAEEEPA